MLRVEDLHVAVGGKTILRGVNLHIKPGKPMCFSGLTVLANQHCWERSWDLIDIK